MSLAQQHEQSNAGVIVHSKYFPNSDWFKRWVEREMPIRKSISSWHSSLKPVYGPSIFSLEIIKNSQENVNRRWGFYWQQAWCRIFQKKKKNPSGQATLDSLWRQMCPCVYLLDTVRLSLQNYVIVVTPISDTSLIQTPFGVRIREIRHFLASYISSILF